MCVSVSVCVEKLKILCNCLVHPYLPMAPCETPATVTALEIAGEWLQGVVKYPFVSMVTELRLQRPIHSLTNKAHQKSFLDFQRKMFWKVLNFIYLFFGVGWSAICLFIYLIWTK